MPVIYPRTGVTGGTSRLTRCWQLNSGPLEIMCFQVLTHPFTPKEILIPILSMLVTKKVFSSVTPEAVGVNFSKES